MGIDGLDPLITVPILLSIGPGLTVLVLTADKRLMLWINWFLGGIGWFTAFILRSPLLFIIGFMGLTEKIIYSSILAGVFEESIRYIIIRHRFHTGSGLFREALCIGLGWGVMEALIIYVLTILLVSTMYSYPWTYYLPGAVERNWAIIFHVALTILIAYTVKTGKWIYGLTLTVSLHTLLNLSSGLILVYVGDPWIIEGLIGLTVAVLTTPIYYTLTPPLRRMRE